MRRAHLRTTAIRLGGIPLPGSREARFEGALAETALARMAALAARFGDEQEDGKTGRFLAVFPPSCEFSLQVARSSGGTMPTFPVFQGIGSTSAWGSAIPGVRTLRARLTPACSWPWG